MINIIKSRWNPSKGGEVSKRKVKVEKEGKSFAKPKSTIIIEGQKDSEVGEVDKGREKTL